MLMTGIILAGLLAFFKLPREAVAEFSLNWAFIMTSFSGVSPEEVEKLITVPIEDEIADVERIESITSTSSEGFSFISVKFETMSDDEFDKVFQDLKGEVDKVKDLPEDADEPEVVDFSTQDFVPMINVVVSGDISEKGMKKLADDLKDDILDIKNVAGVELAGVREREIWVEVDPERLNSFDLSLNQVIGALSTYNYNVTGGNVQMGRSEYLVRTMGEFKSLDEIKKVIVRTNKLGGYVRVSDFAEIKDTFEKPKILSRLDGKPSVTLSVTKKVKGNSIEIIDQIKKLVKEHQAKLPPSVKITLTSDSSIQIRDTLSKLQTNALLGMILLLAILYFFLGWRNAFFAALCIPVVFLATFFFMWKTGRSLNGSSLFGLVLVLGMVVDDSIVIIENCYRYIQKGVPRIKAVMHGTAQVASPIIAFTATTIAAFLPLMLLPGIVGKFMKIIPIVVSLALVASLVEAFLILPSHIAEWGRREDETKRKSWKLMRAIRRPYIKFLHQALHKRYWVVTGVVVLLLGVASLIPLVGLEMFADEDIPTFMVWVTVPSGSNLDATDKVISQIQKKAMELPKEEVKSVIANTGLMQTDTDWYTRTSVGQVIVDLVEQKYRKRTVDQIMNDLRERCKNVTGIETIQFSKINTGPPSYKPVEVKVKGKDLDELQEVTELIKAELKNTKGVYDITDDWIEGSREFKIDVKPDKAALLGLDVFQVAATVRTAFEGVPATQYREADEEIDVVVKFEEESRENLSDVANMKIANPMGNLIPLKDIADFRIDTSLAEIRRFKRERAITISAEIDKNITSSDKINQMLVTKFADIEKRYPGYKLDFGGEFEEFKQVFSDIGELFLIGVLIMYTILAAQFKSFIQPLIIMFTIPFGFIGSMVGLLVNGYPFSVTTLFGIVALAGIVVNDSLVMIDFINKARARGANRWYAIMRSAQLRIRPILLTSITTICGLLPMALGLGGKSVVWGPLANTIVWGLLISTIMTLFVIPCLYAIVDDIKNRFGFKLTTS
jgi:multidrug efflux pump